MNIIMSVSAAQCRKKSFDFGGGSVPRLGKVVRAVLLTCMVVGVAVGVRAGSGGAASVLTEDAKRAPHPRAALAMPAVCNPVEHESPGSRT